MRRQFLKQLMMSIAELIAKLDGSDGSMALAC